MNPPLHITQHKRFVPYGTHQNYCFIKISFMLGTLYKIRFIKSNWNTDKEVLK